MTKLDDHKEGMSDDAYKEMAEAIKRVREEEGEPLFEVAYTTTTVTAVCMDFDDEFHNHLMFTHTKQTKIMRFGGQYTTASQPTAASFEKGFLAGRITDGVIEPIIKTGDQLINRPPSSTGGFSRHALSRIALLLIVTVIIGRLLLGLLLLLVGIGVENLFFLRHLRGSRRLARRRRRRLGVTADVAVRRDALDEHVTRLAQVLRRRRERRRSI